MCYVIPKVWSVNCWKFTFFTTFKVYLDPSLPRKIMEQSRFFPAKLWSNIDHALQSNRVFILLPTKLWSNADFAPKNHGAMKTLPRKIMET